MTKFNFDTAAIPAERDPFDLQDGQEHWDNLAYWNRELKKEIEQRDAAIARIADLTKMIKDAQKHVIEYYLLGESE